MQEFSSPSLYVADCKSKSVPKLHECPKGVDKFCKAGGWYFMGQITEQRASFCLPQNNASYELNNDAEK
jgi:hypothetical protein